MFCNLNLHTETNILIFKWEFTNYPHLKVTECGKIINIKTGRKKKVCINGYSKGVWVTSSKFLTDINSHIKLIE